MGFVTAIMFGDVKGVYSSHLFDCASFFKRTCDALCLIHFVTVMDGVTRPFSSTESCSMKHQHAESHFVHVPTRSVKRKWTPMAISNGQS